MNHRATKPPVHRCPIRRRLSHHSRTLQSEAATDYHLATYYSKVTKHIVAWHAYSAMYATCRLDSIVDQWLSRGDLPIQFCGSPTSGCSCQVGQHFAKGGYLYFLGSVASTPRRQSGVSVSGACLSEGIFHPSARDPREMVDTHTVFSFSFSRRGRDTRQTISSRRKPRARDLDGKRVKKQCPHRRKSHL